MIDLTLTPLQLLAFFCVIVLVAKWLWSRKDLYILSSKLPGDFALPIVGNVKFIFDTYRAGSPIYPLQNGFRKYNGLYRVWLGSDFHIVCISPEDVENAYSKYVTDKPPKSIGYWVQALGSGLITMSDGSKDSKWKMHKKIITPSFSVNVNKEYFEHIERNCTHLQQVLQNLCNKGVIDFGNIMLRFTADCVTESMYGVELKFRNGHDDELFDAIEIMTNSVVKRIIQFWYKLTPLYNWSQLGIEQKKATDKLRNFAQKIFDILIKDRKYGNLVDNPEQATMKILIKAYVEGKMNEDEVVGEIMNLWNAATDTTGVALQFLFLNIAMHKKCQDKIFAEIKAFFGNDPNQPLNFEDLSAFPYTEMCIKETLRLFSSGPYSLRYVSEAFTWKNTNINIPAGTSIVISSFLNHRNPKVWDQPEKFIPERFSQENSANRHAFAFAPFSGGPRKCSGRAYGMMLMKSCVIHVLKKYELYSDWKLEELPIKFDIDIRSVWGYKASISERNWI